MPAGGTMHGLGIVQVPVTLEEVPRLLLRGTNSNSFAQTVLDVTIGLAALQRGRKLIRTVLKPDAAIVEKSHLTIVCPRKLMEETQVTPKVEEVEHRSTELGKVVVDITPVAVDGPLFATLSCIEPVFPLIKAAHEVGVKTKSTAVGLETMVSVSVLLLFPFGSVTPGGAVTVAVLTIVLPGTAVFETVPVTVKTTELPELRLTGTLEMSPL